jgi:hypothetical protein
LTRDKRKEYDFSGGIREKHYKAYRAGYTVCITKEDGTTSLQYFTLKDGSVMLDPDVKPHSPDSDSVNIVDPLPRNKTLSLENVGFNLKSVRGIEIFFTF